MRAEQRSRRFGLTQKALHIYTSNMAERIETGRDGDVAAFGIFGFTTFKHLRNYHG
jgi:hypothetical protein